MSTFDQFDLDPAILKAIHACGYTTPTLIQAKAIPDILAGKDVVGCAQTGTGKTAAFVLPALNLLCNRTPHPKPRILVLTPTRELASQITDAVNRYGKFLKFGIASLVGGMPYRQQLRALSRPLDIVVATPGRLMDHMENRKLDLSQIEMLVLDEADRMLDMGFIDDIKHISNFIPKDRQTLLFSATFDNRISSVVKQLLKSPERIDLSKETITPAKIQQILYYADTPKHKMDLLTRLIAEDNIFKAIIFSATKINADRLAHQLHHLGYEVAALHGDLKQNVRNKTLEQLRRGKIQFLVATDVAARGLDVTDITHVINYDVPRFAEDYVHRIGRTGRAGKEGLALSIALRSDNRFVKNIERFIGQKIPVATLVGLEPKPVHESSHGKKSSGSSHSHGHGKNHKKRFYDQKKPFQGKRDRNDDNQDRKSFFDKKKRFGNDKFAGKKSFKDKGHDGDQGGFGKHKKNDDGKSALPFAKKRFGHEERRHDFRQDRDRKPAFDKSTSRFGRDDDYAGKDRKSAFGKSKSRFSGDESHAGRDDRKRAFGKSKSRFGGDDSHAGRDDRKPAFGKSKSRFGRDDSHAGRDDRKPAFGKSKSRFGRDEGPASRDDRKPAFGKSKGRFGSDENRSGRDDRKPSFGKSKSRFGKDDSNRPHEFRKDHFKKKKQF